MIEKIAQYLHIKHGLPINTFDTLDKEAQKCLIEEARVIAQLVKTKLEGSLLTDEERRELCKKCPEYYISDDPVSGTERCKFMGMLARTTICEKHLEAQLAKTIGRLGV